MAERLEGKEPMNYIDTRFEHDYGWLGRCIKCFATREEVLDNLKPPECSVVPSVDKPYPKPESMEEERERLWRAVMEFSSS